MWAASSSRLGRAAISAVASGSSSKIVLRSPTCWQPSIRTLSTSTDEHAVSKWVSGGRHDRNDKLKQLADPKRPSKGQRDENDNGGKWPPREGYDQGSKDRKYMRRRPAGKKVSQPRWSDDASHVQVKAAARPSRKGKEKATDASTFNTESANLLHQRATLIAQDEAQETKDSEEAAEAESEPEDSFGLMQDQLRSYFSAKTTRTPFATLADSEIAPPAERDQHPGESEGPSMGSIDMGAPSSDAIPAVSDPFSELVSGPSPEAQPQFTRPTLADIQNADLDTLSGFYQSETAWHPARSAQDDTPPQEVPQRQSFLRSALTKGRRQYIVVLLDADNLLFDPRHMSQGYDGGRFVYQELRTRIARKHQLVPHMLDLRVRAFCALHALTTILDGTRLVRRGDFIDFWQGLCDSSLHNYVVNVGRGDQAADLRVKAALADAIQDPDCFKAYLGGLDDFGYMEELQAIKEMGLLEKKVHLVEVPGYAVESNLYKQYAHRAIDLDYLFRDGKLSLYDLVQRKHDVDEATAAKTKQLASTPCLFHHLTAQGCQEGARCQYSHEPISLLHKERLRDIIKRRKCPTVARGEVCPYGDDCIYKH